MKYVFLTFILPFYLFADTNEFYTPPSDIKDLWMKNKHDKTLPNVLLIGDSISMGYHKTVVKGLNGKANVYRPRTNCGDTPKGLREISKWLGKAKWDVIHFNFGLHDLCYRHPKAKVYGSRDKVNGTQQVPVEQYKANLEKLVQILKKTEAKLIFATTTFIPEGEAGRFVGDDIKYNKAALEVMKKHDITINDLWLTTSKFEPKQFRKPGDVHFTGKSSEILGKQVIKAVEEKLKK